MARLTEVAFHGRLVLLIPEKSGQPHVCIISYYTVMFVSGRIKTAKTIHYLFSGNHDEDSVDLMK